MQFSTQHLILLAAIVGVAYWKGWLNGFLGVVPKSVTRGTVPVTTAVNATAPKVQTSEQLFALAHHAARAEADAALAAEQAKAAKEQAVGFYAAPFAAAATAPATEATDAQAAAASQSSAH